MHEVFTLLYAVYSACCQYAVPNGSTTHAFLTQLAASVAERCSHLMKHHELTHLGEGSDWSRQADVCTILPLAWQAVEYIAAWPSGDQTAILREPGIGMPLLRFCCNALSEMVQPEVMTLVSRCASSFHVLHVC